jgi:hypothetical protein
MDLPAEFEFDPAIQNAAWLCDIKLRDVYNNNY